MKNLKHIKLFEQFNYKSNYKLVAKTEKEIIDSLKWFMNYSDVTNGFVQAIDNSGDLIKKEILDDHRQQFIKKTELGYEIKLCLFNYDGTPMNAPYNDGKWDLPFIHRHMRKDRINAEIIECGGEIKEGYDFSKEPPSWTTEIDGKEITIPIEDVQKYLDKNNAPIVEIPVKDIFHLCAHRDKKAKETLERSQESSLDYPIIVSEKDGKYTMVLDGHHRLLKAKNNNIDRIKARIIELSKAPYEYQKMFS